jgi:hypothetical protein
MFSRITFSDPLEVEEDVEAVVRQVLVDGQGPGDVGTTVADEDGLFDAAHVAGPSYLPPGSEKLRA